jgi:hypothetical protein
VFSSMTREAVGAVVAGSTADVVEPDEGGGAAMMVYCLGTAMFTITEYVGSCCSLSSEFPLGRMIMVR